MLQTDQLSNICILLGRFGTVSVPGLGTFWKVTESAYFSSHRDFLFPPFQKILFDDSYDINYDLHKLFKESGYRQDVSGGIDSINGDQILSMVKSEGFCEIKGIGKLIFENNQVKLLSDDYFANGDYWGLEKIDTTPVPLNHLRNNPTNAAGSSLLSDQISKEKKSPMHFRDWILPLTAIIFTILLLSLRYMSCSDKETLNSEKQTNSTIKLPSHSDENFSYDQTKKIVPVLTDTSSEANKVDTTTSVSEGQNSSQTGECIIIVGAFSNTRNAQKMLRKVKKAGYIPYSQKNNGLTRVGMSFECREDDLTDSMISMRKKFTRDAWYLKPSIAIER